MALNRLPRFAPAAALLAVCGYYAVLGGEYSAFDLQRLDRLQAEETAALDVARSEVAQFREQSALLQDDAATLERVARERFGMIRPGETLYRFVEVEAPVSAARIAVSP
jgi:cell division protein FtsB